MSQQLTQARRGRPCGVCSLSSQHRTAVETALAAGTSISRISKLDWAPGRESIAFHVRAGHLPQQLQQQAERAQGLDHTTVLARVTDIARRARTVALEATEAGDRTGVLRAGDSELRALSVLVTTGETSEQEIELRSMFKDLAAAVVRVSRRDPETAETIAAELDRMHRPAIADDIREQADSENEVRA